MGLVEILSCLVVLLLLVVYFIKRKYSYWKDMGVPYESPIFPFGNIKGIGKEFHQSVLMKRLYSKMKAEGSPFCGIYFFLSPVVLVTSLDFVRTIMVKDNSYFTDRGSYYNEDDGIKLQI